MLRRSALPGTNTRESVFDDSNAAVGSGFDPMYQKRETAKNGGEPTTRGFPETMV